MKAQLFIFSILFLALACFTACEDKDETEGFSVNSVNGVAEKGPFPGSTVTVYELDNNLEETGRVFKAKTDDDGSFAIHASTSFVSEFVKISVSGFYFNEYTGKLSAAPIVLEAIASLENKTDARINVNVLTHLEAPRILSLISSGVPFQEARAQANEELLEAFLITGQTFVPEETTITANNTSANILIAISSILLNKRTDAEVSEFMSMLRNDLVDGSIDAANREKISTSSFGLNYVRIKDNIEAFYSDLKKEVEVGDFGQFIDGDGVGMLGDDYLIIIEPEIVEPIEYFQNEENARKALASLTDGHCTFFQNVYLLDAVYTHSVASDLFKYDSRWMNIYRHQQYPENTIFYELWAKAYSSILRSCNLIEALSKHDFDWKDKYIHAAKAYRACVYLNAVSLWGDVPLILETPGVEDISSIPRTPQDQILDFIINELDNAYLQLPEEAAQPECSKYFAKAIQARAYLYKQDYARALESANAIINSGKYSLSGDLNAIYAGGNAEVIFELPENSASLPLYKDLIKKGDYLSVCRYTEVVLMAAEASWRLGNLQGAASQLNLLKARRGQAPVDQSAVGIENALLSSWKEEMANEGLWFAALKRLGKAQTELNIVDYQLLMPIPRQEMLSNSQLTQNPGY